MKRILSIILTLSIVATLFAGLGLNASAATNYAEKMTVANLFSNDPNANATVTKEGSVVTKDPTVSYWKYDSTAVRGVDYVGYNWLNKSIDANANKLWDGTVSGQFRGYNPDRGQLPTYMQLNAGATANSADKADYTVINSAQKNDSNYDTNGDGVIDAADADVGLVDVDGDGDKDHVDLYVQIEYDLGDSYGNDVNLDKIVITGGTSGFSLGSYDLFISDNLTTLYDAPVYEFRHAEMTGWAEKNNDTKSFSSYSFTEGTRARYVAIRIYKYTMWTDAVSITNGISSGAYLRVNEFNVYGTRNSDKTQNYTLTATGAVKNSSNAYTPLTAAESGISDKMTTSLIRDCAPVKYSYALNGTEGTKPATDANKVTITSSTQIKQCDLNIDGLRHSVRDANGLKKVLDTDDNYYQLAYKLDASANIDSITLATNTYGTSGISGSFFAPYHVKYSLADSEEDLFVENESVIYDVYNVDSKCFLTIDINEDVTAKYIAVRVVCGVTDLYRYSDYVISTSCTRLGHFSVSGTYVNPAEANVTVAKDAAVADVDAITVSKGEVAQSGITDTNGKFPVGSVVVSATNSYRDESAKREYTFAGWYNGDNLVSATNAYTYNLTGGDVALTAKYTETKFKHTVSFVDATKNVVKTILVEDGELVPVDQLNGIVVKDIYGYTVKRDAGNIVWDKGFDEAIVGDTTYTAQYEAIETLTTLVNAYEVDGVTKYLDNRVVRFDTQINLRSEQGAEYWADAAGNVLVGAPTGTLYACGTAMTVYAKKGTFNAPEVTFVGKEMKDGKFTVFAHAAPAAKVKAYGIIFASNTYKENYDKQTDKGDMFTLKDTEAINKVKPSLKVSEVNVTTEGVVDFMATLNGCGGKVRHARAYVTYTDGRTVYSKVIVTNN